jgi:phospholipase C
MSLAACSNGSTTTTRLDYSAIKHIVIVVKENHSFDNYFGALEDPPLSLPHCESRTVQVDCQYGETDIPAYYSYARSFGYADNYFTDILGPSWPNHMMMIAGQTPLIRDPAGPTSGWICPAICYDFPTIADRLQDSEVSWRNYGDKIYDPFLSIDRFANDHVDNAQEQQFFGDVSAGSLPAVSWVRPSGPESEHPGYDVRKGEDWTVGVIDAIMRSSYWASTAVLVTWDDAGDVVDHVSPPVVERETSGAPIRYGHRVALLVISPFTHQGTVSHTLLSHVSLLRFIEDVFHVQPLTSRDRSANGLSDFFDFSQPPRGPLVL